MHPTADTLLVMLCESLGAAGDAGRYAAYLIAIMIIVDAAERLSERELEDAGFDLYPSSTYVCPACDERVSIRMKDLERHFLSDFTNLEPKDADAMAEAVLTSKKPFNSFLDFYCPGCHNPVRIYFNGGVAGKGTFGCTLSFVIEGAA